MDDITLLASELVLRTGVNVDVEQGAAGLLYATSSEPKFHGLLVAATTGDELLAEVERVVAVMLEAGVYDNVRKTRQ